MDVDVFVWRFSPSRVPPTNVLFFRNPPQVADNPALGALSLFALEEVEGPIAVVRNAALASLSAIQLRSTGGGLAVAHNPALATTTIPALTSVAENLHIDDNASLGALSIPALASVGKGNHLMRVVRALYLGGSIVVAMRTGRAWAGAQSKPPNLTTAHSLTPLPFCSNWIAC